MTESVAVNIPINIQLMLKMNGYYNDTPDGKLGPITINAIKQYLSDKMGVDCTKWTKARIILAAEQAFYKSIKIPGADGLVVDGLAGPQTEYTRKTFLASRTTTWRDAVDAAVAEGVKIVTAKKPIPETKVVPSWPKQSECNSFYGKPGTNQVSFTVPYEMVLSWEPKTKVKTFQCHKKVAPSLDRIFTRTKDYYGYEKVKELRLHYFGGCLNVRKMRGGSSWSMHSWGIAVDLDPDRNDLHSTKKTAAFAKPEYKKFWEFVYDEGAISLGIERDYDYMHFQFAKL